jgi:4-hydroxythreonine-4-phosphate dehydrogenase
VLAQLDMAVNLCQSGECHAMVTAPVHKAVINDAGVPFSGHTEYLARATGAEQSLMLLTSGDLRVALATTHLPLREVPDALNARLLKYVLCTLHHDLASRFSCAAPRITVLGLNPHAGEGGHLGSEDQAVIAPVCEMLRGEGLNILGPVPADSAFIPSLRAQTDAYLAMYHDQGLPVLKALGFHGAVNVTLGLPIIRTSVDHGTALDLAATGKADAGSLRAAIQTAIDLA